MSCPRLAPKFAIQFASAGAVQETFQLFDRSAMMAGYQPDPKILTLGPEFFDAVEPARFPQCLPRYLNARWSDRIGLDLGEDQWAAHFCRFEPLPGNLTKPLALRYHGHQFRVYNPEIGDGRGFLFAQLRDDRGRLLDLGTKGSGETPYSRHADGRLTLKGGVREVLATEMLEALGVNTSKTFALFETGEALERGDEPSPTRSAVLTRLSHGHIRIGTFQRLAFFGEIENIREAGPLLPRQSLRRARRRPGACCSNWRHKRRRQLAASYLAAGFVHGVLNSDNINITGESFDYGPWRFTPEWDPDFTAAYFDHYGLYAFGRQPEAIHWDLAQLAGCLSLVAEAPATVGALGELERTLRSRRWSRSCADVSASRLRATTPRCRRSDRGARHARSADRSGLLRLARRARPRGGTLSVRAFRALAKALRVAPAPGAPILVRRRALLDANRRGRGDLVGDCRARRLAAIRGQG